MLEKERIDYARLLNTKLEELSEEDNKRLDELRELGEVEKTEEEEYSPRKVEVEQVTDAKGNVSTEQTTTREYLEDILVGLRGGLSQVQERIKEGEFAESGPAAYLKEQEEKREKLGIKRLEAGYKVVESPHEKKFENLNLEQLRDKKKEFEARIEKREVELEEERANPNLGVQRARKEAEERGREYGV